MPLEWPLPAPESVSKIRLLPDALWCRRKSPCLKILLLLKSLLWNFASFTFFVWQAVAAHTHHLGGARRSAQSSSFVLNYAEDLRRRLMAGVLRSTTQPEEPHNTTAVLSANAV